MIEHPCLYILTVSTQTMLGYICVFFAMSLPLVIFGAQACVPADQLAKMMFMNADHDHDAVLHLAEWTAVFAFYDTDHDGRVSRTEFTHHHGDASSMTYRLAHVLFDLYDDNGDHHLEPADYAHFYAAMDSDGDDAVSVAEFVAYWEARFLAVSHHHEDLC